MSQNCIYIYIFFAVLSLARSLYSFFSNEYGIVAAKLKIAFCVLLPLLFFSSFSQKKNKQDEQQNQLCVAIFFCVLLIIQSHFFLTFSQFLRKSDAATIVIIITINHRINQKLKREKIRKNVNLIFSFDRLIFSLQICCFTRVNMYCIHTSHSYKYEFSVAKIKRTSFNKWHKTDYRKECMRVREPLLTIPKAAVN